MEHKETHSKSLFLRWREAFQSGRFRIQFIISCLLLLLCAVLAPLVFQFVQQRPGHRLEDIILDLLPAVNLSVTIFVILYGLILIGVVFLFQSPEKFMTTLQAYILLTVFRFITLLVFPLEPPFNMQSLNDPFVDTLFYQSTITKDLFFSGHTSIVVLLALSARQIGLRILLSVGAVAIGLMLLLQHAHYTIDVLAAPLFAWLAIAAIRWTVPSIGR